jgi:nicotinamidase-related amidase
MSLSPIDLRHTALVLIDLQRGIVGIPAAPHSGKQVVENAVRLAERFRRAKATVVLVHVAFSPDGKDVLHPQIDQPTQWPKMPDDWAELVPELGPQPNDIIITKRQWGAFYGTELDLQLRRRGVNKIVLGGISTNIGVESTARAAFELGYHQVFPEDAMAAMSEEDHWASIRKIFPRIGQVRSTDEILAACTDPT